ncbi:sensor histidine kinase [Microbispora amethystogenes]|uniref:Histidine kinase n=1 Tax=Microbispora amethystogenes TaxID=1427754 RepID=A0ABQ4F8Y6_9ACTN|nr:histidine kinase [Microbispora amethystogenes]GIH31273.1 histidine kinase [Microbispora amethystogenes]
MNAGIKRARHITFWTLALELVFAWLGPVLQIVVEFRTEGGVGWSRLALVAVGLPVFSWLFLRVVRAAVDGRTAVREVVVSGAVALVMIVLGADVPGVASEMLPFSWSTLTTTWTGVAVLGVSARTAVALTAGAAGMYAALDFLLLPGSGEQRTDLFFYLPMLALLPYSNRLWLWIYRMIIQVDEGRKAQAELAVTEERLRFARDLHDLVGHSLSAIAVKSELAVKLARAAPDQATEEMTAVRGLAKDALREIREAVRGYRAIDLSAELGSVRAVLEAANIRCTLDLPERTPPGEAATLLAWVVREGATNTLRHSAATRSRVTLRLTGGTAVLEMVNDGVGGQSADDGGTGLIGLSERLAAAGGSLTARPTGSGEFVLRAVVPATDRAHVLTEAVTR